jgi:hypothetical protein
MSQDDNEARLVELVRETADARSQLREDLETLAHKVSPSNLKQEAIEATEQAARQAKAAVTQWGGRGVALAREYPLLVTTAAGFGALFYAAMRRRSWRLMMGAVACGSGALVLGVRAIRRAQPSLTPDHTLRPYSGDWHALPSATPATHVDATVTRAT